MVIVCIRECDVMVIVCRRECEVILGEKSAAHCSNEKLKTSLNNAQARCVCVIVNRTLLPCPWYTFTQNVNSSSAGFIFLYHVNHTMSYLDKAAYSRSQPAACM